MITRQTIVSILTTTAIAFSIAPPALASSMAAAAQATTPVLGDERDRSTQREVKNAIVADPDLAQAHIAVSARSGQVTLAGVVRSAEQRERAQRAAGAVRGVRAVDNAIEVVGR